ncbi:MAG: four helix bundle protein [Gemmataceae bacterium]
MTNDGTSEKRVYDLAERTALFGEAILDFAMALGRSPVVSPLVSQIVRSGTSVGANYCEADDAVSRKEFLLKIGTCRKESRETQFWLRMIARAVPTSKDAGRHLYREAGELHKIFSAIRRRGLGHPKPPPPPKG